jgi:glycosyltransferase involved in cell wall biosynthesis
MNHTAVLFMQSQEFFGADSMIHGLIMEYLDRSRYEVHAAVALGSAGSPSASFRKLQTIPNLHLRPTSFGPSINFRSRWQKLRDTFVTGPRAVFSLIGLVLYARRHRVKLVHCTEKPRDAFYGYLLARLIGAKCIVHIHVKVDHSWMLFLTRFAMRHADALVGVSDFVRDSAVASGYPPGRCFSVLNALEASDWDPSTSGTPVRREFDIPVDSVVLATISRVSVWKGHTDLLRALAMLPPDVQDFRLLLVGEDDIRAQPGHKSYIAELRVLSRELGLEDRVVFTGYRTDVQDLLAATDIYSMPSFEEPFGVVFLEAMAMERPVVALASGGVVQVVDECTGLLSEPGDIPQLAENLARLMRDGELRRRLGRCGRERVVASFGPRGMAEDVEGVYEQLLVRS